MQSIRRRESVQDIRRRVEMSTRIIKVCDEEKKSSEDIGIENARDEDDPRELGQIIDEEGELDSLDELQIVNTAQALCG